MSRLEIILSIVLAVSVMSNIGLIAYVREAILRLLMISEEIGDLQQMVNSFANHVESVYELETFYGDETLHALLEHAISFNEQLDTFEYIYSLTEKDAELNDKKDSTEEEEEEEG